MVLDLQFKIKNDPNLIRYLRENSFWYKELNRNPDSFKRFVSSMKDAYQLSPSDKMNKLLDSINMVQSFLDVFK